MEIVTIVLPIFGIIGIGYLSRHFKLVAEPAIHSLNMFAYYVALPAVIVSSFWPIRWSSPEVLGLVGFNLLSMLVFSGLIFLVLLSLHIDRKTKAAIFMAALVGNTIYMGFPLVGGSLRPDQFVQVAAAGTVHLALGMAFAIIAVELWVVRSKRPGLYAKDFFTNPLVVAMIAGVALSFIRVPYAEDALKKIISMLGSTASPVALFALGGFLHGKFLRHHVKLTLLPVALKLVVFPFGIWFLALPFGVSGDGLTASALLAAMPTAVTAFVVSEKYRLDESFVANCILLSTVISLFTLSFFLWVS